MAVLAPPQSEALASLARLPTTTLNGPPCVRTTAVFNAAPTGIALPLNRKTTQQAITPMPLDGLEPRQEFMPVQGVQSYIVRPRRDPPDVARVQMRDGRVRLLVQEGHTRLAAAILRGDTSLPIRVWEFVQTESGGFTSVVRGRHRIGERQRDRPYRDRMKQLAETFNLPNISDVNFPTLIGAIPSKPVHTPPPRKKRRPVQYKGVKLSRAPMQFEAKVLSLTEIPPRLDLAVDALKNRQTSLVDTLSDIAQFGVTQALTELVRQGAPEVIMDASLACDVATLAAQVETDRTHDLDRAQHEATVKLSHRRIPATRQAVLARELADRSAPGILTRHAKRAVNMAFALGRATVIAHYRRPHEPVHLAYHDDEGKFTGKFGALVTGAVWVDKVIQTAVMDTNTCDECEAVDGEVMELGEDRQEELHPPYVKCEGGDRCRCIQIAILSDGTEIEVDEVPDEAYDET